MKPHALLALALWIWAGLLSAQTLHVASHDAAPDLLCGTEAPAKTSKMPVPATAPVTAPEPHIAGLVPAARGPSADARRALLMELESRQPLRVALWGDSHGAARFFSDELLSALGLTGDQVLPSFIPPTFARPGVRLPLRKFCQSAGWTSSLAFTERQPNSPYHLGLASLKSASPGAYVALDWRNKQRQAQVQALDIYFQAPAPGNDTLLAISADDGPEYPLRLSPALRGVLHIRPHQLLSTLKIRLVAGEVILEGFRPQYRRQPLMYFDTLGIPGATARGWRMLDPDYLSQRNPPGENPIRYDVVMLEYGTNEANDPKFDADNYRRDLRQSLTRLRQVFPDARCYLLGPTDRGLPDKGALARLSPSGALSGDALKFARIHRSVSEMQQSVALEFQCRAWNWQEAMGGPGGAYQWFWNEPPLMAKDLIHATPAGYRLSARLFADFLHWPEDLPAP